MSWSRYTRLKLTDKEIEHILEEIKAKGIFGTWTRQSWGWSTECDISKNEYGITFSGAGFSRRTTLPDRFIRYAKKLMHDRKISNT